MVMNEDSGKPLGVEEVVAYPYQDIQWRKLGDHELQDPQIRILVLEGSRDFDAPIACQLKATYVTENPQFEALSYTWGDLGDKESIAIGGYETNITRDLHIALQHLRRVDGQRRLWIDALCINQDDLEEKSEMVRIMHIFYRYAERTIIWLGLPSTDSDLAFDIIARLGARPETKSAKNEIALLQSIMRNENPTKEASDHWVSLQNFFGRAYWKRLWIVQEIAYSSDYLVKCGGREMDMLPLLKISDKFSHPPAFLTNVDGTDYVQLRGMRTIILADALRSRAIVDVSKPRASWGEVLSMLREFRCSDLRDKIFGCMTLAQKPPWIAPDYESSIAEVYTDVACRIIEEDRNLRILSNCDNAPDSDDNPFPLPSVFGSGRYDVEGLPSWCPNWANVRVAPYLHGDYEIYSIKSDIQERVAAVESPYRAAGQQTAEFQIFEYDGSLVVHGFVLDGVVDVSPNFYGRRLPESLEVYLQMCDRNTRIPCRYRQDPKEVFFRTLVGNRDSGYGAILADDAFSDWKHLDSSIPRGIAQFTAGRLFFTTCQGYMGMGPWGLKSNDQVCLLKGCFVPMILRRVKIVDGIEQKVPEDITHGETSFYRVIGPAYVHGVMEGELADLLQGDDLTTFTLR